MFSTQLPTADLSAERLLHPSSLASVSLASLSGSPSSGESNSPATPSNISLEEDLSGASTSANPSAPSLNEALLYAERLRRHTEQLFDVTNKRTLYGELYEVSNSLHFQILHMEFIKKLRMGNDAIIDVIKYFKNMVEIHAYLESAQEIFKQNPIVKAFYDDKLLRAELIKKDIECWVALLQVKQVDIEELLLYEPAKVTEEYCLRLIGGEGSPINEDPGLLVAHMFVFYSMVLSDGNGIRGGLERLLKKQGFTSEKEKYLASFTLNLDESTDDYLHRWYDRLNRVLSRVPEEKRESFIEGLKKEVRVAFQVVSDFIKQDLSVKEPQTQVKAHPLRSCRTIYIH
ncbi:MAG: biliverdin-producing heme oxygenase [Chlamydiales bacterium]|nr:biliverdin-producing heme oxygenase [Chlamydiales bacterium]